MATLTDTQALILRTASHHPDGIAAPPASLPPAPRGSVAKALLKAGLLEVTDSVADQHPGLAWKLDGQTVFLRITAAGLQAIGVAGKTAAAAAQDAREAPLTASNAAEADTTVAAAETPQDAATAQQDAVGEAGGLNSAAPPQDAPMAPQEAAADAHSDTKASAAPTASTAPLTRASGLRAAAQQVLAAWDDAAGERTGLAEAIEALRAATPPARAARQQRQTGAPHTPRAGTKQEAVLALLRRPEGASGPDMIAATGWAPHTVRGFLAGLKKRGIAVLVHERVRQVGPGKEGAKGSYTIYRIAAEPAA